MRKFLQKSSAISLFMIINIVSHSANFTTIGDYVVQDDNGVIYVGVGDSDSRLFGFEVTGIETRYMPDTLTFASVVPYDGKEYNVVRIGKGAFKGDRRIKSVVMPSTVEVVMDDAFAGSSLRDVALNEGLQQILPGAFSYTRLNDLNLPSTLRSMCEAQMSFGGFMTYQQQAVMMGCDNLESITVGAGNERYYAVDGMLIDRSSQSLLKVPSMKKGVLDIPTDVAVIESCAIQGCKGLTQLNMPSGNLNMIKGNAVYINVGLEHVTIPASAVNIYENPFAYCYTLERIDVESGNERLTSVDGVLYSKDMWMLYSYPGARKATKYKAPKTVKAMVAGAFGLCSIKLEEIEIPGPVTKIPAWCFYRCFELKKLILPSTVETIEENALPDVAFTMVLGAATPPEIVYNQEEDYRHLFTNEMTIVVPKKAVNAYREHPLWGKMTIKGR